MKREGSISLGAVAAFLLSAFFIVIVFYALLAGIKIRDVAVYESVMVFSIINAIILLSVCLTGPAIAQTAGRAPFISVCFTTGLYTVVMHANNFLFCKVYSVTGYTLVNLVLLFIYLCIALPTVVMGIRNKS